MFDRIGRPAALLKMSSCTEFSRFLTASIEQWLSVPAFVIKVSVLVSTQQKQPIKVLQEKHFLEMLKIRKNSKDIFQGIYRNLMYTFLQNNSIISSSVISIVSSFSVARPYLNQGLFSNFLYFFWLNLIFMLLYTSSCTEKSCS